MQSIETLLTFIEASAGTNGYSRSYDFIFLKILFYDLWENNKSYVNDVAQKFKDFYASRINEGKIPDIDADKCIKDANISSISDVVNLIKAKPYKYLYSKGFLTINQDEQGEYFVFTRELNITLTRYNVFGLMALIYKKIDLYFSKIDDEFKKEIDTFSLPQLGEREQEFAQIVNGIKAKFAKLNSDSIIDNILDSKEEYETICKTISVILSWKRINYITTFQKELMALFLVGTAKYYYNDGEGGFWNQVEKIIPQINGSNYRDVINAFSAVIKKYNLPAFKEEQSEGFKLITPIICHAGIPINCLDSWFDVVFQLRGVKYSNIENELDYASRYAHKPVQRYVKFLSGRAILADEVQQLQELLACVLSNKDIPECLDFSDETRAAAIVWAKNKGKTGAMLQRFASPELVFDVETFKLSVHLPKMKLKDESNILWEIKAGSKTITKKEYGRTINSGYFYNDCEIVIDTESDISVKLTSNNGQVLDEFCLKSEKDFLVFNNNGKQNKSRFIPKKPSYFICDYDVAVCDNLQNVYEYGDYTVYVNNPEEANEVWLEKNSNRTIFTVKEKPELIGGKIVFDGNADFEDIDAYYCLPQIAIPFDGELGLTLIKDNGERIDRVVFAEEVISIENVIKEEFTNVEYGVYRMRIKHDKCGYHSFKFAYLPKCSLIKNGFFPNEEGYDISKLVFNCSEQTCVTTNNEVVSKIEIPISENIFEGCLCYNQLTIPFHVHLKAFTWEIFDEDKSFGLYNKKSYISSNDLIEREWVMLNIRNHTDKTYTVEICCGEHYVKNYILGSNRQFSFNLKELSEAVSSSKEDCSTISIQVTNELKFPVCCIRKELYIRKLTGRRDDKNNISFCWREDGSLTDRELVVANLILPYEKKTYLIEDGQKQLTVDKSAFEKDKCYIVYIQYSQVDSLSIYDVVDDKKRIRKVNGLFKGRKLLLRDEEFFEEMIEKEKPSFDDMIYSYLFISLNDYGVEYKKERGLVASVYRERIIEYRSRYGDAELYKNLFKYDLDDKLWAYVLKNLALIMPCFLPNQKLNDEQEELLKDKNLIAYVQYLSATKQISKIVEVKQLLSNIKDVEPFVLAKADLIFPSLSSDKIIFNCAQEWKKTLVNHKWPTESEALLYTMVDIILDNLNKRENRVNKQYSNAVNLLYTKYRRTLLEAFMRRIVT